MPRIFHPSAVLLAIHLGSCLLPSAGAETAAPLWPPPTALHSLLQESVPSLDLPLPPPETTNSESYLRTLAPKVLVDDPSGIPEPAEPIGKTAIYKDDLGYVRVDDVHEGLPLALSNSLTGLLATNQLRGLILDLRFAGGSDFDSAAKAASFLAQKPRDDFRLGDAPWPIRRPDKPLSLPLMILVNHQTREAAEALAAAVRATTSPSLILGTNTAGTARLYREITVAPELHLRVAHGSLILPGGADLPATGLQPDLPVAASEPDELHYRTNEFVRVYDGRRLAANGLPRLNEAELIRRQRGIQPVLQLGQVHPPSLSLPPSVQDPVLGRGLDLLDALTQPPLPQPAEGDSR